MEKKLPLCRKHKGVYFLKEALWNLLWLFSGIVIGFIAWPGKISVTDTLQNGLAQLNVGLLCILALPVLWSMAKKRWQASLPYFTYVLVGTRDLPFVYSAFFPGTFVGLGFLGWLAQAAFLALPWLIMWKPHMTEKSAVWRVVIIVLMLSFPPFGFIGWLNPLVLAGYMYPGAGWFGIVQFLLLFALFATVKLKMNRYPIFILGMLVCSSVGTSLHYQKPIAPVGWLALSTQMGPHPLVKDLERRFIYQERLIYKVETVLREQRPAVLFLPESVAGSWLASNKLWWQPVANYANATNATLFVGAEHYIDNNHFFYNSLIDIGKSEVVITDRFPMPFGQWRPWTSPSAKMDIFANNAFTLDGKKVAMSVCYEDFVFWLQALTMGRSKPDVMVSIANNWFAAGADEPWIQARHIQLWADLWGVPLLRAVNL